MIPEKKIRQEFSLGVDISGGYIRLAEISFSEKGTRIESCKVIEVPREKDGSVSSSSLSAALKDSFAGLPARNRKIYCLLSGTEVVIRRIAVPKLKEKELLEAIKWDMKSHVPFTPENTVFDYKLLGILHEKGVEKLDILAAAVAKEAIVRLNSLFEASGIELDGISVVPFAAWNLMKKMELLQKGKTTALINIGSDITSIVFFNGEDLEFFRELPIAGNNFTKAMIGLFVSDKWQMDITYEQAEKIKRKYGIPEEGTQETTEDNIPLSQISQLLRPVLRRFLNEVIRSFSFYKENYQKETIDRVLISGGSSKLKNIESFLATGLETGVRDMDGLIKLESAENCADINETLPHLYLAVGIALSQAKEINLLKRAKLGKKAGIPFGLDRLAASLSETDDSIKLPALIGGTAVLLFALAVFSAVVMMNGRLSEYNKIIEDKRVVLNNVKQLSEQRAIINRISADQTPVRQVLAELANILPEGVILDSYSFTNSSRQAVITGTCAGMKTVGAMLRSIELSTIFSSTSLIEAKRSGTKNGIDFKLVTKIDL